MFEWDKKQAVNLLEKYKKFWGPSENAKYGITGKPDAHTGKTNAKSVYLTVKNHGKTTLGRGVRAFLGAGSVLDTLEEIIAQKEFLETDLEDIEDSLERLKTIESSQRQNPANINFRTIISFKAPKGEEEEPFIERGVVLGHFLTPAYWEFRRWSAEQSGGSFPSAKPDPKWTARPEKAGGTGSAFTAKPPLWQAIFGSENSLRKLTMDIMALMQGQTPVGTIPIEINANLGPKTATNLSTIAGLNKAVKEVMADGSIYGKNTKVAIKSRINTALSNKVFSVSASDMRILVENCTIRIDGERVELDEVLNYDKITSVSIKFPSSNKTLNSLVRAVMGEEMQTYDLSNLTGWQGSAGITLKQVEAIKAVSDLIKVLK